MLAVRLENTITKGNSIGAAVTFDGTENQTCRLSGFTIRNGIVNEHPCPPETRLCHGGGIYGRRDRGEHSRATIEDNIIAGNSGYAPKGIFACNGRI